MAWLGRPRKGGHGELWNKQILITPETLAEMNMQFNIVLLSPHRLPKGAQPSLLAT